MTKKDYILIANIFNMFTTFKNGNNRNAIDYITELINRLAQELKKDNPNFDAVKFRKACGLEA